MRWILANAALCGFNLRSTIEAAVEGPAWIAALLGAVTVFSGAVVFFLATTSQETDHAE